MNERQNRIKLRATPDPARLLDGLHTRANRLRELGHYAESEWYFRSALRLAEQLFDAGDVRLVPLLNNFALLGKCKGDFDEAEARYLCALAIAERHLGEAHIDVATLYHNLGALAHARGDYAGGEPLARRAVEIRKALLGPDHPDVLVDLTAWGALLHGLKQYDKNERTQTKGDTVMNQKDNLENSNESMIIEDLDARSADTGKIADLSVGEEREDQVKGGLLPAVRPKC